MTSPSNAVVVTAGPTLTVPVLGELLGRVLGLSRIDANFAARKCGVPGILAEGISREQGRTLIQQLASLDVTARLVTGALPAPHASTLVRQLKIEDDRLVTLDELGKPADVLPLERARLLHVGEFGLESRGELVHQTPDYYGDTRTGFKMSSRRTEGTTVEAWLYADGPPVVWRLPQEGINYKRALGPRAQPETGACFRILLELLRQKAPYLQVTDAYTGFVLKHMTEAHRFETIDHFERTGRAWLAKVLIERQTAG